MKCQVCQYDLPAGVTFCPNCGTPVPANPYGQPSSSPNQGIPPTVMASPSSPNQGVAPTVMASSPTPPPDPYGAPPVSNPYGTPSTDYGASTPSSPYGAPPPYNPAPTPYGAPPQAPYGTPGMYGQPMPPKKSNRGCVTAIIIAVVLFVVVVGGIIGLGVYGAHKAQQALATATTTLGQIPTVGSGDDTTPTTSSSNTGSVPSSSQIDANARANITSAQTSLGMDNDYKPTHIQSSFTIGDEVDITFTLSGKAGYAMVKLYRDNEFDIQSDSPLEVKSGYTNGAFPVTVNNPGSFVAGLYWCQQSDCSDAALAQVVNFSVS